MRFIALAALCLLAACDGGSDQSTTPGRDYADEKPCVPRANEPCPPAP
jgi:hypothetical protein